MTGEERDVLARVESRLGRIEAAITHNHREVIHRMTDIQKTIDTDVSALTQVLADFAGEWQQLSQRLAMEAPQIDTSKLDGIAQQALAMDAAWKAQLAPAPADSGPAASTSASPASVTSGTGTASADTTGAAGTAASSSSAGSGDTPATGTTA